MAFDIAAIIFGHREGESVRPSLRSFDNAVGAARAAGLRVQVIQHLDDPDPATLSLFDLHRAGDTVRLDSALRDPGIARNMAIEAVEADHVALLDADDLWSFDWLTAVHGYLHASPANVVVHPQFQFRFGKEHRILRIPDQESFEFDLDLVRLVDIWNGIGACRKSVFQSVPFRPCGRGGNVAGQEWAWNLDSLTAGNVHKVIPQTAVFRHVQAATHGVDPAGPVRLPPETALSRYDSALHDSHALRPPLMVAGDGFLDEVCDVDIVQLHHLLLGRAPDDRSPADGPRNGGLVSLAGALIRSDEFAGRLHRMIAIGAPAVVDVAAEGLSKDWVEQRFGVSLAGSEVNAMAASALLAVLSSFPLQQVFDGVFGQAAVGFRDSLGRKLSSSDDRWNGYLDHCSVDLVKGWVVARGCSRLVTLAVRVGGNLAGICEASLYRRDVAHAFGTDGLCGFELVPVIDWRLILEPRPVVTLHDVETGEVIPVSAEMANPRGNHATASRRNHLADVADGPLGGFASTRVERYDLLLSRHLIPAAPLPELFMRKPSSVSIVVHADHTNVEGFDATLQAAMGQSHAAVQLVIVLDGDVQHTSDLEWMGRDRSIDVVAVRAGPDARDTFVRLLEAATGDHLCFVESGCVLDVAAIAWFAFVAQRFGARIVYADDVSHRYAMAGAHRCQPHLKPGYDYDLLLQGDYMSAVFCASRTDLAATAALPKEGGAIRQFELLLQLLERVPETCIFHVPLPLHACRDDDPAPLPFPRLPTGQQRRVIKRHLLRTGAAATLREVSPNARTDWSGGCHPHWAPPLPRQRMTIVIPTRDRVKLLKTSVDSLQSMMADPASCEILIMDNGSEDPATLAYLDLLRERPGTRVVRSDGPFNWSALNNAAALQTDAELLLFANNDIEVFTEGFDDILRGLLGRPDIGAVGTLLLYPNGTIQHAGTAIGIGGVADHIGAGRMPNDEGVARIGRFQRSVGAVTGAFLAVRRRTFEQVGGFDDVDLKIAFSDVDLCLKIGAAGLRVLYTPHVVCLHHESASRGLDTIDPAKLARANEEIRALKRRWGRRLAVDCHYNAGYDRSKEPFTMVGMPNVSMVMEDLEHQSSRRRMPDGRHA